MAATSPAESDAAAVARAAPGIVNVQDPAVYKHFALFTRGFASDAVAAALEAVRNSGLLASLAPSEALRVLDVAAGTGAAAFEAIQLTAGIGRRVTVHATDRDAAMLQQLRKDYDESTMRDLFPHATLTTAVADACSLSSVPDASVHVATMVFALNVVKDPVKALRELQRVLVPGGVAVVMLFHFVSHHEVVERMLRSRNDGDGADAPPPARLPIGSEAELRRIAAVSGVAVTTRDPDPFVATATAASVSGKLWFHHRPPMRWPAASMAYRLCTMWRLRNGRPPWRYDDVLAYLRTHEVGSDGAVSQHGTALVLLLERPQLVRAAPASRL